MTLGGGASRAATTDLLARLGTSALGGTDAAIATLAIGPGICRAAGRGALVFLRHIHTRDLVSNTEPTDK